MSALREWAATLGPAAKAAVAVNSWGKWKTATQVSMRTGSAIALCMDCCNFSRISTLRSLVVAPGDVFHELSDLGHW